MDMILFRVSIQRLLVIQVRSKWNGEGFLLECLDPLSFSNTPSIPFSISFCKSIDLFPLGINSKLPVLCMEAEGSIVY